MSEWQVLLGGTLIDGTGAVRNRIVGAPRKTEVLAALEDPATHGAPQVLPLAGT